MRLPRAAACLCCGSVELLKLLFGFSLKPAAHCNCTGLKQAGLTEDDREALGCLFVPGCLFITADTQAARMNVIHQADLAPWPQDHAGVAQVSPCQAKVKFMLRSRKCLHACCAGASEACKPRYTI